MADYKSIETPDGLQVVKDGKDVPVYKYQDVASGEVVYYTLDKGYVDLWTIPKGMALDKFKKLNQAIGVTIHPKAFRTQDLSVSKINEIKAVATPVEISEIER
jgi:hypothetical protein